MRRRHRPGVFYPGAFFGCHIFSSKTLGWLTGGFDYDQMEHQVAGTNSRRSGQFRCCGSRRELAVA